MGDRLEKSIVKDITLADAGARRMEWARRHMPVLQLIKEEFEREDLLRA
jgi:adenosylhomocysteinase (EC 3.3.1.1)